MLSDTPGIHHITGLIRDAQANLRFYRDLLGLRFVKQTVNFNDKFTRHLFYGDASATPGTILSFFPYPGMDPGRIGKPQITAVGLSIPPNSTSYWIDRLTAHGVTISGPCDRFDETVLKFNDPDSTQLELVTSESDVDPLTSNPVPPTHAIRGIFGVTILSTSIFVTASVLETLGFELLEQEGNRVRYQAPGTRATRVDLLDKDSEFGREGTGSIHHVAMRVQNKDQLFEWHDLFRDRGYDVSRVKDRYFFHSLYVREPGGILFELATETPGLGGNGHRADSLFLPPWLEPDRDMIGAQLPPFDSTD